MPDIPDPELVPHRDWDEFALRAWVEKRRQKERTDAAWKLRQAEVGRYAEYLCLQSQICQQQPCYEPARTFAP